MSKSRLLEDTCFVDFVEKKEFSEVRSTKPNWMAL